MIQSTSPYLAPGRLRLCLFKDHGNQAALFGSIYFFPSILIKHFFFFFKFKESGQQGEPFWEVLLTGLTTPGTKILTETFSHGAQARWVSITTPKRTSFYLRHWKATKELSESDKSQTLVATEHANCTANSSCFDSGLTKQSSHKLVFHKAQPGWTGRGRGERQCRFTHTLYLSLQMNQLACWSTNFISCAVGRVSQPRVEPSCTGTRMSKLVGCVLDYGELELVSLGWSVSCPSPRRHLMWLLTSVLNFYTVSDLRMRILCLICCSKSVWLKQLFGLEDNHLSLTQILCKILY